MNHKFVKWKIWSNFHDIPFGIKNTQYAETSACCTNVLKKLILGSTHQSQSCAAYSNEKQIINMTTKFFFSSLFICNQRPFGVIPYNCSHWNVVHLNCCYVQKNDTVPLKFPLEHDTVPLNSYWNMTQFLWTPTGTWHSSSELSHWNMKQLLWTSTGTWHYSLEPPLF